MNWKSIASFLVVASIAVTAMPLKSEQGMIVRLDPRFDQLVPEDAALEKIADGFHWVEGPAWNRKENSLFFSDIPRNSIFRWKAGAGTSLFLNESGYTEKTPYSGREPGSNGLTFDHSGRLIICEHGNRRITRLEADGTRTTMVASYHGKRLNSPNDATLRSNGDLYFTDPPFGLPQTFDDPSKELPFSGVFRLSANGKLTLLTAEINAPNGIAFSPDERILYLTDVTAERPAWLAYEVREDGTIENGRVFFDATPLTRIRKGGPDGMKVDRHGNLFAAGPGAVYVFAPDGTHIGSIQTGVPTSNCAWGDDGTVLYITADTAIYRIKTTTRGANL